MNIRAHEKYIKVTPKKMRFVVKSIKMLKPVDALARLNMVQNRSAKMLYKAIKSAVDNGIAVHKISAETLSFAELKIDEGVFLRRMRPGARGMGRPYHRKTSHITVVLEVKGKQTMVQSQVKETKKIKEPDVIKEIVKEDKESKVKVTK